MKLETIRNILLALFSVCVVIVFAEFTVGLVVQIRDVGPSFSQYDPVLGKRLRPNFTTVRKTPEFTMTFSTNSLGFRGADVGAMPRNPILFLGDSFTMGYGVNDGEEFPAVVAARLEKQPATASVPVVNAGIGDSGNGRWIKLLRAWKGVMQPRLVVMQVLDNDFEDNVNERLFAVSPDGALQELPVPSPGAGRMLQAFIEAVPGLASTNLVGLLRQVRLPGPQEPSGDVRLTIRILEKAILMCREQSWPVLGLLVGLEGARAKAVRDLFLKYHIDVLEIPGKTEEPQLYYRIDGHWNALGHAVVAERVLKKLQDLGATGH